MPSKISTSAVSTLEKKLSGVSTVLSNDEMLAILEDRREIIARLMKSFSNKRLGEIACLTKKGSGNLCHSLEKDDPSVEGESFSLQTRGIFAGTPTGTYTKDNFYKTFGIGNNGNWLLIKIKFSLGFIEPLDQHADVVYVSEESLETIIRESGIDPFAIYHFLENTVDGWVGSRKRFYEDAIKVQEGWKMQSLALYLLQKIT